MIASRPRAVQDALVDTSSPRQFASITRLPGVGHLVPQEAPAALAFAIARNLETHLGKVLTKRQNSAMPLKL